jgi:hypothetical protein
MDVLSGLPLTANFKAHDMMKIKASNKRQRVKSYQSVEAIHIKNDVATPVRCSVGRCHCKDIRMGQRACNDNHDYVPRKHNSSQPDDQRVVIKPMVVVANTVGHPVI